jgi:hypothetical protein
MFQIVCAIWTVLTKFYNFNIKSYNIKDAKGKNLLIEYFEKHEDLKYALDTPFSYEDKLYPWVRPPPRRRKKGIPAIFVTSKNQGNTGSAKKKPKRYPKKYR